MTKFTPECFLEAHRLAFSQFEATRNNIRLLRDSRDLVPSAALFAPIDTKVLLRLLSYQAPDGMHYLVPGEIERTGQFTPSTLEYMYQINTRILLVNTAIGALKELARNRRLFARVRRLLARRKSQPPLTVAEIKALLTNVLDGILLGTRAIAETFWYMSKVANQHLVMRRIVAMAGYANEHQALSLQEAAEADQIITKLIEQYKARRSRAAGEILANALNSEGLSASVAEMHAGWIPLWMDQVDLEGAKIVNDVWVPPYYLEQVLHPEARSEAQELAA
jgi:hypothetical protein